MGLGDDVALSGAEAEDLQRLDSQRLDQVQRAHLAARLLRRDAAGAISINARIHLLDRSTERALEQRLSRLEDQVLLLQHCAADPCDYEVVAAERTRVANLLAERVLPVCAVIGRSSLRGIDGSPVTVGPVVRRAAAECAESLLAATAAVIHDAIDADLFVVEIATTPRGGGRCVDLRVRDDGEATSARAHAFAAEIDRLARLNDHLLERIRYEGLRDAERTSWPDDAPTWRRRQAQAFATLDRLRSLHAAMAEVEQIERAAASDPLPVDGAHSVKRTDSAPAC
ncbi:MAG: hypothetical protein ABIW84_06820 [Ilumatobacteraceae bacterium]